MCLDFNKMSHASVPNVHIKFIIVLRVEKQLLNISKHQRHYYQQFYIFHNDRSKAAPTISLKIFLHIPKNIV